MKFHAPNISPSSFSVWESYSDLWLRKKATSQPRIGIVSDVITETTFIQLYCSFILACQKLGQFTMAESQRFPQVFFFGGPSQSQVGGLHVWSVPTLNQDFSTSKSNFPRTYARKESGKADLLLPFAIMTSGDTHQHTVELMAKNVARHDGRTSRPMI